MSGAQTAAKKAEPLDLETLRAVEEFLIHEADLLDQRRFEEWGALFTDDGIYWVPAVPGQENPFDTVSIFYDDREGREVRIRRLRHPKNLPQEPPNRTLHIVQNVRADRAADGEIHATSRLLMLDYREGVQRLYGATCQHRLRPRDAGGYAIAFKRVDLLNCDGFLPMMSIPF
ncbi:MAG TPA: aromatic-ring-hydroxylating dioxygenase subunit beta [Alphaproteobacteria bacterium]|jgi:benzoate/toluate 1,2-dioxygenase beta subunit